MANVVRPGLLRDRDDRERFVTLRHRSVRRRRVPRVTSPVRPHDRRRHRLPQDGAGDSPHLRSNAGAALCDLDGLVRHVRQSLQYFGRRTGGEQDCPSGRFGPGLPATTGSAPGWIDQAARKDPTRKSLREVMNQTLAETLLKKFPDAVRALEVDTARGEVSVSIQASRLLDLAHYLRDAPEASFNHLTDICSVDYPEDQERFEMVYHLHSLPLRQRLRVKARVPEDHPSIASVTGIWKGAEFLEREVYDMMGITFTGHPDLRRILLPEDYA